MPYTKPNTYVDATAISADEIRENHDALRRYINDGISEEDFGAGSVLWTHIRPGEYQPVTGDHRFMTGWHYVSFVDAEDSHWTVTSQTIKMTGQDVDFWHTVMGKRVRLQRNNSPVLVTFWLNVRPLVNTLDPTNVDSDDVKLYVDDAVVEGSFMHFYAKDSAASPAGGTGTQRIRCGCMTVLVEGLSAGLHSFQVRINPKHDLSLISSRSIHIEVLEA